VNFPFTGNAALTQMTDVNPMTEPLVSAIIPTYNYARYMADCVGSVLGQSYRNVELIVVDDGSTDETCERLEPYMDRIRYIYQENRGVGAARNTGIKEARGEYVALLDADDVWHPRKIEMQMKYVRENPVAGVVAAQFTDDRSEGWPALSSIWPPKTESFTLEQLALHARFLPSGVLIQKSCFDSVGIFRTEISGADDRDLFVRIASRYPIVLLELPLVYAREHGLNQSNDPVRMDTADRRMLNDLFDRVDALRGRRILRRKAFSSAACSASLLYAAAGNQTKALARILESFVLWPFHYESGRLKTPMDRLKILGVILLRMLHLKQPHRYYAPVSAKSKGFETAKPA
jgi:glycosyltransferase involved in cell wall biosynthesis